MGCLEIAERSQELIGMSKLDVVMSSIGYLVTIVIIIGLIVGLLMCIADKWDQLNRIEQDIKAIRYNRIKNGPKK